MRVQGEMCGLAVFRFPHSEPYQQAKAHLLIHFATNLIGSDGFSGRCCSGSAFANCHFKGISDNRQYFNLAF